jgi:hypothetical protein
MITRPTRDGQDCFIRAGGETIWRIVRRAPEIAGRACPHAGNTASFGIRPEDITDPAIADGSPDALQDVRFAIDVFGRTGPTPSTSPAVANVIHGPTGASGAMSIMISGRAAY